MTTEMVAENAAQATDKINIQWVNVAALTAHPKNPRIGVPDKLNSIIESMRAEGYRHEKPMLVRPFGDGYQIIGGHTRHAAAQEVGIERVPCVIEEMDDDTAILRIARDNLNDPLAWYSICLYVFQNAIKDSKKGLSRTQLVMAATGKEGDAAKADARRMAAVGEVLVYLIEQSVDIHTLLDMDKRRDYHIDEIHKSDKQQWALLAGLLVEHDWSVKDTKAAVDRVKAVSTARPAWFPDSAIQWQPIAIGAGLAKSTAAAFTAMAKYHDQLQESVTLYSLNPTTDTKEIDGREHLRWEPIAEEYAARQDFIQRVLSSDDPLAAKSSDAAYRSVTTHININVNPHEEWKPVLTDAEEAERQARMMTLARLEERELFMPRLLQGDVVTLMRNRPSDHYDLICIDPPYNMDKADWDSFGSGQEFAAWARQWLTECRRVLNDSGAIYIFGINRMLAHLQGELEALGFHYRNWIIWDTIQGAGGGLWVNRHEAILYYSKTDAPYEDSDSVKLERHEENVREYKGKEYAFKNPSNVWRFPCVDDKHAERTEHPTQKPVELIERIVLASSPRDGRVLDCFMGSGTTGVACMKHRRYCTGIEQNDDYIQIAQARFDAIEVGK